LRFVCQIQKGWFMTLRFHQAWYLHNNIRLLTGRNLLIL